MPHKLIVVAIILLVNLSACEDKKTQDKLTKIQAEIDSMKSLSKGKDIGINWILVDGNKEMNSFYISSTEVTFEQFDRFCDSTGYKKPIAVNGRGKHPVINVNVADANAYCKWASKETGTTIRLPHEPEWRYAASGGRKGNGNTYNSSGFNDKVAWPLADYENKAHEVGQKKPNELGIYDMDGNVWEWCDSDEWPVDYSSIYSICWIGNRPLVDHPDTQMRTEIIGFRVIQFR